MALIVKDRVKETSSTAGTGTLTLAGTSSGFQSFSVIGNGNTTYYAIVDNTTGDWEVGIGTYTSAGTTLSRDTILESSNGGAAVNFAANSKDVFVTYPAEKSFSLDQTLGVLNGGTGQTTYTDGQLLIGNSTGNTLTKSTLTAGSGITISNGSGAVTISAVNTGTVTSVDLSAGTGISVSGGPITSAGSITVTNTAPDQVVSLTGAGTTSITGTYPNFTVTSNDQYVGTVTSVGGTGTVNGITLTGTVTSSGSLTLGGTLSGVDLATQVTGTLPIANGGTGQTTYTDGQLLIGNSTGNTLTKSTLTAGSGISITNGSGAITIAATGGGGSGTVTSVDVSGGATGLTTSGGPITTSGTITLAGTLDVDNGGTGQTTYTDGQLLIGNTTGNTLTKSTLTAGSGISITNGSGAITIAATAVAATTYTGTASSGSWSGSGPYTQDVTLTGLASTDTVILDLNLSAASYANVTALQYAYALVYRAVPGTNKITLYATSTPADSFDIYVTVI